MRSTVHTRSAKPFRRSVTAPEVPTGMEYGRRLEMAKVGKKGATAALQTEVTTEEEWKEVLERKGLVVVDVYSEWSGPCHAMISTLRKIKMEIGGDVLSYAVARNDEISSLARFRGKSEPVWMFLQDGKMTNLIFGSHCPNLQKFIIDELRRVQQEEPPKWSLPVEQRAPEEESRWQHIEAIRTRKEGKKMAKERAEARAKYEEYLDQETFELCEETAIILYPWVFLDDEGYQRDKGNCPAYTELVQDVLERFDILEQTRIQLDEQTIEKMFVESRIEITEDIIEGLTRDKCMAIRIKCKPPPPEWPVIYPNECPEGTRRCPIRAIDDVENYLRSELEAPPRDENVEGSYLERHVYVYEPDAENEEDYQRIYPAVWFPPQARSKVHVYKTLFGSYMDKAHPYEEPVMPLPLCAFKFDATKFAILRDAYESFVSAIEKFGVFEYDAPPHGRRVASNPNDFENKVKYKTGNEIFVIVLRRINEEAFLAFAGNEPIFVTEENEVAERMIEEYFPAGAVDVLPEDPEREEDFYEVYEDMGEEDEYEEDEEDYDDSLSYVDLSMF